MKITIKLKAPKPFTRAPIPPKQAHKIEVRYRRTEKHRNKWAYQ